MTYTRGRFGRGLGDDAASATAVLEQLKRWSPTGFFTPDQIYKIYDALRAVEGSISKAINQYIAKGQFAVEPDFFKVATGGLLSVIFGSGASDDTATEVPKKLNSIRNHAGTALSTLVPYLKAAGDAKVSGKQAVNAPGLQITVSDALAAFQEATTAFENVKNGVAEASGIWMTVGQLQNTLVKIKGIVLDAADQVVNVAAGLPEFLKYAKWGGLAFLVVWGAKQFREQLEK